MNACVCFAGWLSVSHWYAIDAGNYEWELTNKCWIWNERRIFLTKFYTNNQYYILLFCTFASPHPALRYIYSAELIISNEGVVCNLPLIFTKLMFKVTNAWAASIWSFTVISDRLVLLLYSSNLWLDDLCLGLSVNTCDWLIDGVFGF